MAEPLKVTISYRYASMEELRAADPFRAKAIEDFIPNLLAEHLEELRNKKEGVA